VQNRKTEVFRSDLSIHLNFEPKNRDGEAMNFFSGIVKFVTDVVYVAAVAVAASLLVNLLLFPALVVVAVA